MAAEIAVYKHTKVYGSGSKDYQQSIQVLAKAIQEKVLDYPGGGEAWLAYHGISSLISRQCLQLSSQSFGGLLDRFYPDVVSEKDPQLIQPHEVHNGLWDRKGYARLQILRAFLSYSPEIAGVSEFHELAIAGKPIPSELRKRAYENAKTISTRDFIAHGKLQSIHIRPPAFISPNPTFSLDEIARFCFQPQRRA
jgi:hypothetical protein